MNFSSLNSEYSINLIILAVKERGNNKNYQPATKTSAKKDFQKPEL